MTEAQHERQLIWMFVYYIGFSLLLMIYYLFRKDGLVLVGTDRKRGRIGMVNRLEDDVEKMCALCNFDIRDATNLLEINAHKDKEGRPHLFVYKTDCEHKLSQWRVRLEKIYYSFLVDTDWVSRIDKFERVYHIDFFMLVSFMYMMVPDTAQDKDITTTVKIASTLLKTSEIDKARIAGLKPDSSANTAL